MSKLEWWVVVLQGLVYGSIAAWFAWPVQHAILVDDHISMDHCQWELMSSTSYSFENGQTAVTVVDCGNQTATATYSVFITKKVHQ